jgi:V/A-type H+-transporting ATPase subunit I
MTLKMTALEIVGLKADLQTAIHTLQRVGCVQIEDLNDQPSALVRPLTVEFEAFRSQEELKAASAQVEGLLDALGGRSIPAMESQSGPWIAEAQAGVAELAPKVQSLLSRRDELEAELEALPRYEATLRKLMPIVPRSAGEAGNVSIGVLVNQAHAGILDLIGERVTQMTGGLAQIATGDVGESTQAMLLVFPAEFTGEVEELLGREDVSRLRLPAELGQGPPDAAMASLRLRMVAIPDEIAAIDRDLSRLADQWGGRLVLWSASLQDELEAMGVLSLLGETDMTFVLRGWAPAGDVARIGSALGEALGEKVLVHPLPLTRELVHTAPVALQNPRPVRPFESLVQLLSLPRYGDLDPSSLMALFMPVFFGMMLGDVGYGVLLLAVSLGALSKFKTGMVRDLLIILAMGSGWTIVFGILFGEAFGTLGEHIGMHPLWFDRASPEHVSALLLLSLGVGTVHITLGLILGVREAIREKSRNHLMERGGMLLGLVSILLLGAVLTGFLPKGFTPVAAGGLIVGVVLVGASLGWAGVFMGPVELIGLMGNILSYLRIAAIGLTSVYLAKVANDVAGKTGNVVVGAAFALTIHTVNLVMGAFSPTIHSLRLHYVEFFRKFYEGGGKPYEPFQSHLRFDAAPVSTNIVNE